MEKYQCCGTDWLVCIKGNGCPVLFLHGFPFDHTLYLAAADRLTDSFRVIIPDLPGFGASRFFEAEAPRRFRMEEYADGLAELLDLLGEKRAVVCGLSMGGYIAMQFFRRHPDRLSGLIFCDTRTTPDPDAAAANRLKLADSVFKTGAASLADQMIPNLLSPLTMAEKPEVVSFLREMISRQDPAGIAAAARGMAERDDSTPFLKDIAVPTLALGGDNDKISPPDAMRLLADGVPGASYVSIPDAGHLPPLETPCLFAEALQKFLEQIS